MKSFPYSKSLVYNLLFVILLFTSCQRDNAIYVSPDGNDNNTGAYKDPLATMDKALLLSRQTNQKEIILRGGDYYDVCIEFTPEDSGIYLHAYQDEKVVLYAGMLIKEWEKDGKFLYKKLDSNVDVRYLTVNDEPRLRSRLPETGEFKHHSKWDVPWMSTLGGGWKIQPTDRQLRTLKYDEKDLGSWLNVKNAEVTVFHFWDESQVGLDSIDPEKKELHFSYQTTHPAGAFAGRGPRADKYVVWNIREGMLNPGQWYYDRVENTVFYFPYENEKSGAFKAVVPSHNNVVKFANGTKDVKIEGVCFSTSSTPLVNPCYSARCIDGAISGEETENIILTGLTIENHAGWAVRLDGNNISIKNCIIRNVGAGGVYFKGSHIAVDSCDIHDVGLIYNGSVGIEGGDGEYNRISHCDIYNIPYCGIGKIGKKSIVSDCLIYDFKTFLGDGGAMYQFEGDSTIYRHNVAICDPEKHIEGWTYYFDEGSKNCIAEYNLAVNTVVPMHNHMASDIVFRNNIFIEQQGTQKLSNPMCSNVTFEKNITIADSIYLHAPKEGLPEAINFDDSKFDEIRRRYTKANGVTSMTNNIFQSKKQQPIHQELILYNSYQEKNIEAENGNLFADPMFTDLASADFTFKPESPAIKMGIEPLDFSGVGCTGSFNKIYSKYFKSK